MTYGVASVDYLLPQGSDIQLDFQFIIGTLSAGTPLDMTGYTGRMQMRLATDAVILDLTTANGGFVLTDAVNGKFALIISAADTEALNPLSGVYDIEIITAAGKISRMLEGDMAFSREVTR